MSSSSKVDKRTLLQIYDIPIEFLDFKYINRCNDGKVLEKVVKILRSGEEGFYPDLTKHAEEKLKLIKPDSKLFWTEFPVLKKETLGEDKQNEIEAEMKSWISDMKKQDNIVKQIDATSKPQPPIRQVKVETINNETMKSKNCHRIKSTDYSKWDKYNVDDAIHEIEIAEERQHELIEEKNKKNAEKTKLIEEIVDDEVDCLSGFEKDYLAMKLKEKGNECYKAKDYDEAIKEYTQSLRIKKTAAAFNNRALVYLKLKKFLKVISDTNECLRIEPENIKALIRKGEAFIGESMLNEARDVFEKVLEIEVNNKIAQLELAALDKKLPPKNAFRMKIEEINDDEDVKKPVKKIIKNSGKLEVSDTKNLPKLVQNIYVEEPTPFDKLIKKESKPREKLILPNENQKKKCSPMIQEIF